jgi:hypothetical protein
VLVDIFLSENGKKRLEAIEKINANFRGETLMPDTKPVNG